ncbi:MAG: acyltransferase [Pseudomonadota bacterium]
MEKGARFEALDGWRGICACLVALFHFRANTPVSSWTLIQNAYLFVDFFFVLSGFVLASKYLNDRRDWPGFLPFVALRIGRLYPLHLFTLACLVSYQLAQFLNGRGHPTPMPTFEGQFQPAAILSNLLLVQSLGIHDRLTWNIPSWSISTEFWTCVLAALVVARFGLRTWMLWAVVSIAPAWIYLVSSSGMDVSYDYGLVRSMFGFSAGVICARWPRVQVDRPPVGYLASLLEIVTAAAALWFVAAVGKSAWSLAAPLVFGVVVAVYAHDAGVVSRVLRQRPAQWLGQVSYSIYLNHYVLMVTLVPSLGYWLHKRFGFVPGDAFQPDPVTGLLGRGALEGNLHLVAFMALTFAMSALTFRWVEFPGRRWVRAWVADRWAAWLGRARYQ